MLNKKILIIDDEKNIRITLGQCLTSADCEVETAVDGEHGLLKYNESTYEVVLLDMMMPGIDGIEVLRRIKAKDPLQNVIMITAHGTIETAVEAMKLGAVDYLRKPFSPDEIRSIVKRVMDRDQLDEKQASLSFVSALEFSKSCINKKNYDKAYEYLHKAISMDSQKPEAYNLIGVLLELKGELTSALKMYRAALAVDPAYRPADSNLRRATDWHYTRKGMDFDIKQEE